MEKRFEVRKKQMLADAKIRPEVYQGLLECLPVFLEPFSASLGRCEQKGHLRNFLEGLLSDLKRKNVEGIAYLHDDDRRDLQHFIGESPWRYEPLLAELAKQVGAELGEADGVIAIDPSGFEKDGKHSVGVQRQWLGRLGKIENGQVGVYLGYASRKGHALCDVRLYLPKDWGRDGARRRRCGVPKEVRFQTKHELAQAMLAEQGARLPHQWVTGDDEMGRVSAFRGWLREGGERYLLAVPHNTRLRDLASKSPVWNGRGRPPLSPWLQVSRWLKALAETAWTTVDVRDGEKGPLVVEAVKCRVQTREEKGHAGSEELLFVTRVKESGGWKLDFYLSNAAPETPLAELARAAKAHHRIEDCFRRAKSEAGLADYEVRTWLGWHHHQALSLIAAWFLTREARRGEKMDAGDHGPTYAAAHSHAAA